MGSNDMEAQMRYASAGKHNLMTTKNVDSLENLVLPHANSALRNSVENYQSF